MAVKRWTCYVVAAGLVAGAAIVLYVVQDKAIGIFLILVAAVLARILAINVAERF